MHVKIPSCTLIFTNKCDILSKNYTKSDLLKYVLQQFLKRNFGKKLSCIYEINVKFVLFGCTF